MSLVDAVAAVMFAAVVVYAVFGGADFGSGIWDLVAGGPAKGGRLRRLVDHSVGPVWEANHVWLIFILVFLWSAFPRPFAALMRALAIPFWLVGLGIVLRGAGFAFRKYSPTLRWAQLAGVLFAGSSLITPFFLGTIAGAVASGRVPPDGRGADQFIWLSPTSILGGFLAVLTCTYLAGMFLTSEAEALGGKDLAAWLRQRTLGVGAATGVVALAGALPLRADAPTLFDQLSGRALPVVLVSAFAGVASLYLLLTHNVRVARLFAVVAVASVVAGWGMGQYPWILVDEVTLADGAGARSTMIGLLVASGIAAVIVVPPLVYLFALADANTLGTEASKT